MAQPIPLGSLAPPTSPDNAPAHPSGLSALSKVTWTILLQHFSMCWDFPAFPAELLAHWCLEGQPYGFGEWKNIFLNIIPMATPAQKTQSFTLPLTTPNTPHSCSPTAPHAFLFFPLKSPVLNPGPVSIRGLFFWCVLINTSSAPGQGTQGARERRRSPGSCLCLD